MLIRINGRHDGVKTYLEDGRKKDREQSRDQLDERVILAGDLEVTDAIVQSIHASPDVDRYLHITLSFREDEVGLETLYAVVEDFRKFTFAAYQPDELNFYAEAHVPKLKSYADRKSGLPIERKPHVHIVIPKHNLITQGRAEPLGYVKSNIAFIDAIQEQINAKYGFASPKDHQRRQLTGASEMISRYKGDLFGQAHRDLKAQLLETVLSEKIEHYADFMTLLENRGTTRLRNAGKTSEYPNVTLPGDAKGINLKEAVFARAFIELPTAQKLVQLDPKHQPIYEETGSPRSTADNITAHVDQWFTTRARESKYLNSGNKAAYQAYQAATPADQKQWLDAREHAFYQRYERQFDEPGSSSTPAANGRRIRGIGRLYEFKRGGRARGVDGRHVPAPSERELAAREHSRSRPSVADAKRWEQGASRGASRPSAKTLNGVRSLSSVTVVSFFRGSEVLLPDHALGVVEHQRTQRPDALRRTRDRRTIDQMAAPGGRKPSAKNGVGREAFDATRWDWPTKQGMSRKLTSGAVSLSNAPALHAAVSRPKHAAARDPRWQGREVLAHGRLTDSVVSQHRRNAAEDHLQRTAHDRHEFAEIRRNLSARRLLGELSHSHGVLPEKYLVQRSPDAGDRIQCGSRRLNVSDFLTKELNLSWNQAAPMLRDAYARQKGAVLEMPVREKPRVVLWQSYSQAREAAAIERRNAWTSQRENERSQHREIKTVFDDRRNVIRTDPALSQRQRRSAISLARMERVEQEIKLRAHIVVERDALQLRHGSAAGASFGDYLGKRAQAGDTLALSELRRTRKHLVPLEKSPGEHEQNEIRPVRPLEQANEIIFRRPSLSHQVDANGTVTYRHDGRDVIHDRGESVIVLSRDTVALEAALRLAQAKYGSTLQLAGDDDFQRAAAIAAADSRLDVRFVDDRLNRLMMDRVAESVDERYSARQAVTQPITEEKSAQQTVQHTVLYSHNDAPSHGKHNR